MKQLLLAFCLASIFSDAISQPAIAWEKCYGGSTNDRILSMDITDDGGYFLAMNSNSIDGDFYPAYSLYDTWIVRVNAAGDLLWRTPIGGSMEERTFEVVTTSDNGCVVIGHSNSTDGQMTGNHGGYDIFVAKLNAQGQVEWLKMYGGSLDETSAAIKTTADGGYIFLGSADSSDGDLTTTPQMSDVWLVKLNASGDILWQKTYGGSAIDVGRAFQSAPDGELVILAGTSSYDGQVSGHHGASDFWVFKVDITGQLVWQRAFGGENVDNPNDIISTNDGGYLAVGSSKSTTGDLNTNQGVYDVWLVKMNFEGELEWQKTYGGTADDLTRSVLQLNNGNFVVPGYSVSSDGDITQNYGLFDFWVFQVNASGTLMWEQNYGGTAIDWVNEAMVLHDGSIIIAGETNSKQDDITFNHGSIDGWLVQLAPTVATSEQTFTETRISPNPCTDQVYLQLPEPENIHQIRVVDALGKVVRTQSLSGSTPLDISRLASGAYLVIAQSADNRVYHGKLIKL